MILMSSWGFLKELFDNWNQDRISSKAAALAYYMLFSLAPILLICISILGIVFGEEASRGQILSQTSDLIGREPTLQIQEIIQNASQPSNSFVTKITSFIILLFSASGVFTEIQVGLNEIWGVKINPNRGWFTTLKSRFFSFVIVLGVAFLLLISLIFSAFIALLGNYLNYIVGTSILMDLVISHLLSFFLITVLFAMTFKVLPDVKLKWRDVWLGALITSVLFSCGKIFIELYLIQFHKFSVFGAAGSIIIILIWMFYSSQIFFIGVEITKILFINEGKQIVITRNAIKEDQVN
ncbi:YihY/virulence factor BrkB family protein [Fluoribacter gormanii]|uniref:Membrane protein n=1 Tax=Fluoribacter gormanii TaxID=464 RepID=A0A377GHD7_9GAMM|nr:YihY/virulence factor BrkB family protein [Fluoribacter gormanii]KTD05476.1 ribonuclease BN [Fluoribacter gormanii]MCW8444520.1 YihY/virulence factor BrkB family protein [Fluoribacter gormanii]MCW8469712.1 YihY/virulence factor BrkB family protein [Fluoribacter gormanii]SIR76529.1 membrane protein [Fluoribacter gormanii]STO23955.1 YihY family inner membrane protein [Fluoribacter gormanii]